MDVLHGSFPNCYRLETKPAALLDRIGRREQSKSRIFRAFQERLLMAAVSGSLFSEPLP
jgi:hypothetical protein